MEKIIQKLMVFGNPKEQQVKAEEIRKEEEEEKS
jgi:hypothetical protein